MARTPKIHRTITTTNIKALCLDIAAQSAVENDYILPRTYPNERVILKKLQKLYNTDDYKVEHVLSYNEETNAYEMDELDFVMSANKVSVTE